MKNSLAKKISLILGAAATLLVSSSFASDKATITVTGVIKSSPCIFEESHQFQNITLPDISVRELSGKGKTAGEKIINIVLKDCNADIRGVQVTASGQEDVDDPFAFRNTAIDGATGVGLYFYLTDHKSLFRPTGSVTDLTPLLPNTNNLLSYKATYVNTNGDVKGGNFSTVISLMFEYI